MPCRSQALNAAAAAAARPRPTPPRPRDVQTSLPTNAPRHTILLVQADRSPRSRTFYDFESKTAAMDGVVRLFEENLKNQHKAARTITYDVADLFAFIDSLGDISCLMCVSCCCSVPPGTRR